MSFDFDLVVIGGGSGGVRASRLAAMRGKKVALVDDGGLGGTCVHRGCIPKKLFVYASKYAHEFEDARAYGHTIESTRFDWDTLRNNKDAEIARLEGIYRANVEKAGVTIFSDRAAFTGPHAVTLARANRELTAERFLIATGGRPLRDLSPGTGDEHCITSDDVFHLARLPERIVIVGGGYIAVETAHIFQGLGVRVSVVHKQPKVLRGFDEDLRDSLASSMGKHGIAIFPSRTIARVAPHGGVMRAVTDRGEELDADLVLLAIGRAPNTESLALDKAGVAIGKKGEVTVDETSQTNVPHIHAIGDVTSRIALTPVAIHEAICFVRTVYEGVRTPVDHENVPTAVFTQPEIGTVGCSEETALERGHSIDVYKTDFRPLEHTLTKRDERTMYKLVVDAKSGVILGAHLFGEGSGELIQLFGAIVKMRGKKADLDATISVHPTAAEELVTLRDKKYSRAPRSDH